MRAIAQAMTFGALVLAVAAAAAMLGGVSPATAAPPAPAGAAAAAAAPAEGCGPVGGLHFVCGILNSEDLVRVPGTEWIVASGMTGGASPTHGSLHLLDLRNQHWTTVFPGPNPMIRPGTAAYGACPGAPDLGKFEAHGLNLRPGPNGVDTLYVVNHGGREAIEMFALDAKAAPMPTVTWIGCAVMPPHTFPNSVAPLPDGSGMVVTDMFDPGDPKAVDKMNAGVTTGAVYEWHPHAGYQMVPGTAASGDNGVEVSRDGRWIYIAAWGNKSVVRVSRGAATPPQRQELPAGFLVDNLRWAPDGKLMVAGQAVPVSQVFACFTSKAVRCTQPWRMLKWDTEAMQLRPVTSNPGDPEFGDATVGLQVGNEIFVGTFRGDRIAYFPIR